LGYMSIPLVFHGNFIENYFKMFHLPQNSVSALNGPFIDLLPCIKYRNNLLYNNVKKRFTDVYYQQLVTNLYFPLQLTTYEALDPRSASASA